MKTIAESKSIIASLFLFLTALIYTNAQINKVSDEGVLLKYDFPKGKTLSYSVKTDVNQQMEIEGQSMNILASNKLAFKVTLNEKQGEIQVVEITVDTLISIVDAMGGSMGGDITQVRGKSFKMVLSPEGRIVDNSEGESITYSIDGQNNSSLGQSFREVFPALPDKPIKLGDTWAVKDTIRSQSAGANVFQISEKENKYEKNETVNGIKCAKIISSVKGTMQTSTQNMGMDILMHGPVTGQYVVYFALKEGYIVKVEETSKMSGTIEISSPQSMSFPIVMEVNSTLKLK